MRIIKYGTKKLKMQRFTCPYCGSIFDAEPGEYKTNFTRVFNTTLSHALAVACR